jgi:anti-sigma factor RsiW
MLPGLRSGSMGADMAKKNCRPSDLDLQAYVDGELDAKRRAEIKSALRRDRALRDIVHRYEVQKRAIHRIFDGALDEPLPEPLAKLIKGKPRKN